MKNTKRSACNSLSSAPVSMILCLLHLHRVALLHCHICLCRSFFFSALRAFRGNGSLILTEAWSRKSPFFLFPLYVLFLTLTNSSYAQTLTNARIHKCNPKWIHKIHNVNCDKIFRKSLTSPRKNKYFCALFFHRIDFALNSDPELGLFFVFCAHLSLLQVLWFPLNTKSVGGLQSCPCSVHDVFPPHIQWSQFMLQIHCNLYQDKKKKNSEWSQMVNHKTLKPYKVTIYWLCSLHLRDGIFSHTSCIASLTWAFVSSCLQKMATGFKCQAWIERCYASPNLRLVAVGRCRRAIYVFQIGRKLQKSEMKLYGPKIPGL